MNAVLGPGTWMPNYRTFTALLCAWLMGACSPPMEWHATEVSGVLPDLQFSLLDERGEPTTAADFRGKVTLLFFGFTNCPGVCPATLGHLKAAIEAMDEGGGDIQVLLATVDPDRDTPEALQAYAKRFGPWLHGLTGSEQSLHQLNQAYKVDFSKLAGEESGHYDVMHSGVVFAFDAQGRCRLLIRDTANTAALVSDLERLLAAPAPPARPG